MQSQAKMNAIERLIEAAPKLHSPKDVEVPGSQRLVNWGIQSSFLRYLATVVHDTDLTLETGSGISTVCFAILCSQHICISPEPQEFERIQAYCQREGISTEGIQFVPSLSQDYLPTMNQAGKRFDFALMDGSHAFPIPMIDYYYISRNLKLGGLLAVDDVNIPSVGVLNNFLLKEPSYKLVRIDGSKTSVYRKVSETSYHNDWRDQPFNDAFPDFSYLPLPQRLLARAKWHWTIRKLHQILTRDYRTYDQGP